MKVAFIGTGIMGAPMARNLAQAGHEIWAWNRDREKARSLLAERVHVAESAGEAAASGDVCILMVSTGSVCDALLFGQQRIAEHLRPGSVVVVMSSIPVDVARRQAARLADRAVRYVDAPVSGGEAGAIAGTLAIMAGGDAADIDRLAPVFGALGRVTHVGPVGTGQLAKLANQLIVGVTIGAVAEALVLVERGGGDVAALHQALLGGFADSAVWRQHGARMIARDFAPGAHVSTQLKDLQTATGQARATGTELPLTEHAARLFAELAEAGKTELDHSALYLRIAEGR